MQTLDALAKDLESGRTTSRALAEACLARIADPAGQGAQAFVKVDSRAVLADADYQDALRARGAAPSRYAGLPIAVKDLFDVAGEVTAAGSVVLRDDAPAKRDCLAVARVRAAGFVLVGRANMVEFAYGGIGTNAHHGTPLSVYERDVGRVPGGSSSGSAVAVADGMAAVALGTDTGGSCRIPAAFNAITGYKPSAHRVPREGVTPLSTTLDSVGPLGASVRCCAAVDAILACDWSGVVAERPLKGLRLGALQSLVMADLDADVATAYGAALSRLSSAGASVEDIAIPALEDMPQINAGGGIAAAEAWAWHRERLESLGERYDPRVSARIRLGAKLSAADYIDILNERARLIAAAHEVSHAYDAMIMPTSALVPPRLSAIEQDADYVRLNILSLRNTMVANFLDRCAISLPASEPGAAPAGIMLVGEHGGDQALFSVASAVEAALAK